MDIIGNIEADLGFGTSTPAPDAPAPDVSVAPDAPAPDEVLVIFAVATRGRIRARLGGLRHEDRRGADGLT